MNQFALNPHILDVPVITTPHPLLDLLLPSLISKQINIAHGAGLDSSTGESSHIKGARGAVLHTSTNPQLLCQHVLRGIGGCSNLPRILVAWLHA